MQNKNESISSQPQPSLMDNYNNQFQSNHPPPPPPPPPVLPPQYNQSGQMYYQQLNGQPVYYVGAYQHPALDPAVAKLRVAAIVMAGISCCCGCWLLSIPAIILAVLPEGGGRTGNIQCLYSSSIILSAISIVFVIIIIIIIIVVAVNAANEINDTTRRELLTYNNNNNNSTTMVFPY